MIRFKSDKVEKEWSRTPVALRLVAEALDVELGGIQVVFRVAAPARFENGAHASNLALDLEPGCSEDEAVRACARVNARFRRPEIDMLVATMKTNLANFPSGRRSDRPHVHVQIPAIWGVAPREFLKAFGYLSGD